MVLEHNEKKIGTSPVTFFPNPEAPHHGTLTLTSHRLVYEGSEDGLRAAMQPDESVR